MDHDSEKPKALNDPIIRDEEFDRYEGGKTYSIMNLTLDDWRKLLTPHQFSEPK